MHFFQKVFFIISILAGSDLWAAQSEDIRLKQVTGKLMTVTYDDGEKTKIAISGEALDQRVISLQANFLTKDEFDLFLQTLRLTTELKYIYLVEPDAKDAQLTAFGAILVNDTKLERIELSISSSTSREISKITYANFFDNLKRCKNLCWCDLHFYKNDYREIETNLWSLAFVNRRILTALKDLHDAKIRQHLVMDQIGEVCNRALADAFRSSFDQPQDQLYQSFHVNDFITVTYDDERKGEIAISDRNLDEHIVEVEANYPAKESIPSLLHILKSSTNLRKINIASYWLKGYQLMTLAEVAVNNKGLEKFYLDISSCSVSTLACIYFLEQVRMCKNLQFSSFHLGQGNADIVRSCDFFRLTTINQSIQGLLKALNNFKAKRLGIIEKITQQCDALKEEEPAH